MTNTLLTDLNPTRAATVRGAANLVRCALAGACIAALQPMVDGIGLGWCFGILAILQVLAIPMVWQLETKGVRWRQRQASQTALAGPERTV